MTYSRNAALAAIAAACLSSTAPAAPRDADRIRVVYADLDLASPAGRATLDSRITGAIRTACATGTTDLEAMSAAARCRGEIGRDAHARVAALVEHHGVQVATR